MLTAVILFTVAPVRAEASDRPKCAEEIAATRIRIILSQETGLRSPPLLPIFLELVRRAKFTEFFLQEHTWARTRNAYHLLEKTLVPQTSLEPMAQQWRLPVAEISSTFSAFEAAIAHHREQLYWADKMIEFYEKQGRLPLEADFKVEKGPLHIDRHRLFGLWRYTSRPRVGLAPPVFSSVGEGYAFIFRRARATEKKFYFNRFRLGPEDAAHLRTIFQFVAVEMMLDWIKANKRTPSPTELDANIIPDFFDYARLTAQEGGYGPQDSKHEHRIFDSASEFWTNVSQIGRDRGIEVDLSQLYVRRPTRAFEVESLYAPARVFVKHWEDHPVELTNQYVETFFIARGMSKSAISVRNPDVTHMTLFPFWQLVHQLASEEGKWFGRYRVRPWGNADWNTEIRPALQQDVLDYFLRFASANAGELPKRGTLGRSKDNFGFSIRQALGQEPYHPEGRLADRAIFPSRTSFLEALIARAAEKNVMLVRADEWGAEYHATLLKTVTRIIEERREARAFDARTPLSQLEWVQLSEQAGALGRLFGAPPTSPLDEVKLSEMAERLAELGEKLPTHERSCFDLLLSLDVSEAELAEIGKMKIADFDTYAPYRALKHVIPQVRAVLTQLAN